MHDLEPYYNWRQFYSAEDDEKSPFFNREYNEFEFTNSIYNYCIHPQWDFIGSETLYVKVLYCDYLSGFCVIEMIGEWNDAVNNDIMHLKRNLIDVMLHDGVNKYIIIGEQVMNFHSSEDDYYSEWFEDTQEGWLVTIGFNAHVLDEWSNLGLDSFFLFGEWFDLLNWRTKTPKQLFGLIDERISKLLLW
jgi:hypothetical protein